MTDHQPNDGQSAADAADDELIARLRRVAARADPVPEALLAAASAAFGLRELDVRVAELVRDSAVGASATAVRGLGARMLSFEAADAVIECEVTARGSRRDVIGQLVGAVAAAPAGPGGGGQGGRRAGGRPRTGSPSATCLPGRSGCAARWPTGAR